MAVDELSSSQYCTKVLSNKERTINSVHMEHHSNTVIILVSYKLLFRTFESEPFIDVTESTCIILTSFHFLGLLKLIYKSTNLAL